jgi:hypothetical protein
MRRTSISAHLLRAAISGSLLLIAGSLAAQELPTQIPSKLQTHFDAADREYRQAKPDVPRSFSWPTGAPAAVPCEGADLVLKRQGGVQDQVDEKTKKMYARIERQSGMLPGSVKPPEFRVERFHIVKAQCKDGKLDGEVESWLDYVMINNSATFRSETAYRTHYKATYSPGKPQHDMGITRRMQTDTKTIWSDPAIAKMMESQPKIKVDVATFSADSEAGNVSVMVMSMNNRTKVSTTVAEVEALQPVQKVSMKMYVGANLMSESRMRDGQQHGWQTLHPHFDPLVNIQIPGSRMCFDEGEIIKSNECSVD